MNQPQLSHTYKFPSYYLPTSNWGQTIGSIVYLQILYLISYVYQEPLGWFLQLTYG